MEKLNVKQVLEAYLISGGPIRSKGALPPDTYIILGLNN